MGNVRSLLNRMEELMALTWLQWEHQANTSSPLPLLDLSDPYLVHLLPDCITVVSKSQKKKSVKVWSEEARGRPRDCFDTTEWEALCSPYREDITV